MYIVLKKNEKRLLQLVYKHDKLYIMKTKIFTLAYIPLIAFIVSTLFFSCTEKTPTSSQDSYSKLLESSNSSAVSTHRWFYFTEDGFKETDIPRNAPQKESMPWTNAIRITSSAFINDKAYFSVNKLGIIESPQTFGIQEKGIASETKLIKDTELFSQSSAADIFYIEKKPVISFFTNSIFENQEERESSLQNPFLVGFDIEDYKYSPLLTKEDLSSKVTLDGMPNFLEAEIREVHLENNVWSILLKTSNTGRTDFYALSFKIDNEVQIHEEEDKSIDEYRTLTRPKSANNLPRKIQNLLEPVPSHVSYYLNHTEENFPSTVQYEHVTNSAKQIQGYSLGLDHCSLAIFEDGTICFAGALPSRGVLNNGQTKAFKLPDLGPGFVYGPMSLSGSTLIVSWEETSFFETARTGFLAVDMEQVLYANTNNGA